MLKLGLVDFLKLCRKNPIFLILSFLCMTLSIAGLFVIQEKIYGNYLNSTDDSDESKKLVVFFENSDIVPGILIDIAAIQDLPSIHNASLANDYCTGLYYSGQDGDDFLYTPYGRFFNSYELQNGSNVVLLSTGYLLQLEKEKLNSVWDDELVIDGAGFKAIGSYILNNVNDVERNFGHLRVSTLYAIPLSTFLKLDMQATKLCVVFDADLSEEQIACLDSVINQYVGIRSYSLPNLNQRHYVIGLIGEATPYFAIMLLSFISIVSILLFWIQASFQRYYVYLICGAKPAQIMFFLVLNTTLLVVASFLCSLGIRHCIHIVIPQGVLGVLPYHVYVLSFIGILTLFLVIVIQRAMRLILSQVNPTIRGEAQ